MGPVGFEPTTNQLCVPPQLLLPLSGSWAGLSLHPDGRLPSSLYTFVFQRRRLAREYHIRSGTQASPNLTGYNRRIAPPAALLPSSYSGGSPNVDDLP